MSPVPIQRWVELLLTRSYVVMGLITVQGKRHQPQMRQPQQRYQDSKHKKLITQAETQLITAKRHAQLCAEEPMSAEESQ